MDESEVQRRLHDVFWPACLRAIDQVHREISLLVREKREHGWRTDLSRSLDRIGDMLSTRMAREFPGLGQPTRELFDMLCVASDLERENFPKWLSWFVEEWLRG
jgi:hypothetical protein